ncbi:t-SNARE [Blastocladiella britannica]|nr:t-SNARE [Blastocladiella britannica]
MASRSRTALFVQLRQSNPRRIDTSSGPGGGGARAPAGLDSEKVGLISADDDRPSAGGSSGQHHAAIDMPTAPAAALPPAWVDTVDAIEAQLDRIAQQLAQLEAMHKKQLLPGFDDRADSDAAIDAAAGQLALAFKGVQTLIKRFGAAPPSGRRKPGGAADPPSPQEIKLHKNVASRLASRASGLSTQFRSMQSNYLSRLKSRTLNTAPLFSLSDDDEDPSTVGGSAAQAFTAAQEQSVARNDVVLVEREREIEAIATTIGEIAELFRDMQNMVVEQGSLLDRIDYNLAETQTNVRKGNQELVVAQGYQVAARKKMMIFLLVLAIVFVILLLAIKRKTG